jgi:3-hydroxymyristoyl/3-hydroxydecanoyl-(acyl carrier protein) dehydratase
MNMDETWHNISHESDTSRDEALAKACAETGSPWFSGHFPNDPILPGIAILSMVTGGIKHHESENGNKIRISAIKRVRFRLPVKPDDMLTISVYLPPQGDGRSYHFKVTLHDQTACTGIVSFELLP